MSVTRVHRAGEAIEDYCRACKTDRAHTVVVVDGQGVPIRVTCDYCQSQHNYRGGPRLDAAERGPDRAPRPERQASYTTPPAAGSFSRPQHAPPAGRTGPIDLAG